MGGKIYLLSVYMAKYSLFPFFKSNSGWCFQSGKKILEVKIKQSIPCFLNVWERTLLLELDNQSAQMWY